MLERLARQYSRNEKIRKKILRILEKGNPYHYDAGRENGQPQQGIRDLIRLLLTNTIILDSKKKDKEE